MPKPFVPDYQRKTIPLVPMIAISCVSFLDNFCYSLVNPIIPYMTLEYLPDVPATQIGFYSGWITAAYSLGGIPGNFFWGWFADRYGRRLSISCSIIGVIITINIFGLAQDFWTAFIGRTLWGFLNGNLGIAKTYISEICNDYTQTLGFSIFQTVGGISSTVGPTLGGYLSKPEENFPGLAKQFPILRDYRYYIPCFAACVICLAILIIVLFFLPETLSKEDVKKNIALMRRSEEGMKHLKEKRARDPHYIPTEDERIQEILMEGSYPRLLTNRQVFMACLLYGMLSLVQGGHDALYPVWMINPVEAKGFDWTQSEVGMLYSMLGPIQMVSGPVLNSVVARLLTYKEMWLISGWLYMATIVITPIGVLTLSMPQWVQWCVTYVIYALSYVARILQFTASIVMISNVAYPDFRGKVNGIGQVFASTGRFIGPTIATNVYAWSVKGNYPFPFHFGFVFYLLALLQIAQTYLVYLIGDDANHSMPSIRRFVAQEYKQRGLELDTVKAAEPKESGMAKEPVVAAGEKSVVVVPANNEGGENAVVVATDNEGNGEIAVIESNSENIVIETNGENVEAANTENMVVATNSENNTTPNTENKEASPVQPSTA
ncbi:zinc induced facilitator-like 2 protein [Blastocystis sp. ATCC 50177/Nand II]|uniref:Zinc induced facilitator-like 2 protein n=1 Tax=Blastocystis sp. subtype 1 (strain ATCC 50177 / NandII) TaxID=478820 RepID=A0A196SLZ9_BLAHN|nr:zinc induced facilitator-like 2 protein [Blastocystis sp. ATCC 50177/Nand II]